MEVGQYQPPLFFTNKHLATIYPALLRKVQGLPYRRERIDTDDHDFLDLDWLQAGNRRLVILCHGLEGNSGRPYIRGMAQAFHSQGFDVVAWNYRGCGEEMNRQLRFYHSGATDDLARVVAHALPSYDTIFIVGFSLGGNLTLKYLGEQGTHLPSLVRGGVAISVPAQLRTSCEKISQRENFLYADRFLKSLKKKVKAKAALMPGIDVTGIDSIKTLKDFDDRYTAPIHGFSDAHTYYEACSSLYFLEGIRVPTLMLNAQDDPFLSSDCFPSPQKGSMLQVEYPRHGGHVGFALFNQNGLYWSELRASQFIQSIR